MRELDDKEITALLGTALVAHVAVIDGDTPYVGPLSFVYGDGRLSFRTMDGRRLDAIRTNPAVSVDVTQTGPGVADWASVIVTGTAEIVEDAPESAKIAARLVAKYRAAYGAHTPDWLIDDDAYVVAVTPTEVSGRASDGVMPGRFTTQPND